MFFIANPHDLNLFIEGTPENDTQRFFDKRRLAKFSRLLDDIMDLNEVYEIDVKKDSILLRHRASEQIALVKHRNGVIDFNINYLACI